MSHFLLALVSQFHVLHFFTFLLLLDFVSLLLFVLVLAQFFSSQFLNLLAFLLLLSLESLYLSSFSFSRAKDVACSSAIL